MKSASACLTIIGLAAVIAIPGVSIAQMLKMQPGLWEYTSTTTSATIPGMPPSATKAMEGRTMTIRHCLTAADAAQGPLAAMKKNPSCSISFAAQPNGQFTSNMVCKGPQGPSTIVSSGSAMATSFSSTTKMTLTGAQAMTVASHATGRRVGECPK
ncbi:DUF3617 domain-containing protein [Novosphingobium sp.]|uniref:DUF3617 domain-containing protein n=1 Tax=Novosphingobium sp. TaxID=1874826 RepID=UPI003B51DA96